MKLTIRNFGATADIIGSKTFELDLEKDATVKDLELELNQKFPKLKDLSSMLIAVNEEYGDVSLVLKANDVIALIPPVSGG